MDTIAWPDATPRRHCYLLSLPREIRDRIYEFCVPHLIRIDRSEHPPLLFVSKQIFFEAAEVIYETTCLYHRMTPGISKDLISHLELGYKSSVKFAELHIAEFTFPNIKALITAVALTVDIDLTVDDLSRLSENYCCRLQELSGLRKLYIQMSPYSGPTWDRFRREIQRSDLRVFHIANLMRAVKKLKNSVPNGCEIVWAIPQESRAYLTPSFRGMESMQAEATRFMQEVYSALDAT